ncbi:hypothetical protein Agub_g601, partial [Astrephomene gubernaculifera]
MTANKSCYHHNHCFHKWSSKGVGERPVTARRASHAPSRAAPSRLLALLLFTSLLQLLHFDRVVAGHALAAIPSLLPFGGTQRLRDSESFRSDEVASDDGNSTALHHPHAQPRRHLLAAAAAATPPRKRTSFKRQPTPGAAYVSIGKVRPFTGDVYPTSSLAQALAARAYKREVILVTDTRPRAALQLYDNLAQLGLVHVLWLTSSQASCAALEQLAAARAELQSSRQQQQQSSNSRTTGRGTAAKLGPNDAMGCAWYSQPFPPGFTGHRQLMTKRLMLLARAARLRYNVLTLDTDVIVFRDPYPYLKAPPYGKMQLIVGRSVRGGGVVNTGVMYLQGAAREGPVAWLLGEVVDRNLRWLEHNNSSSSSSSSSAAGAAGAGGAAPYLAPHQADTRGCWDQFLLADVLLSSLTGRLVLWYCVKPPATNATAGGTAGGAAGVRMLRAGASRREREREEEGRWGAVHRAALGRGPMELLNHEVTPVSDQPSLASLVAAKAFMTHWANLTTTSSTAAGQQQRAAAAGGGDPPPLLPEEPGYRLPPRRPGGLAEAFRAQLAAEA